MKLKKRQSKKKKVDTNKIKLIRKMRERKRKHKIN